MTGEPSAGVRDGSHYEKRCAAGGGGQAHNPAA